MICRPDVHNFAKHVLEEIEQSLDEKKAVRQSHTSLERSKFGRKVNSVQQLREEMLDVIGQLEGRLSGKLDELLDEKNVRAAADDNSRYVSAASMRSAGSAAPSVSSPGAWPAQFEEAVAARPEASDRVYNL